MPKNSTESQCARILKYLQSGKTLSQWQCTRRFRCIRLGARIYDLKRARHNITATRIKGSQAVKYSLV